MPDTALPPHRITTVRAIWSELPDSFRQLARQTLGRGYDDDEVDEDRLDYHLDSRCAWFGQDTRLGPDDFRQLKEDLGYRPLVVVMGDLDCEGRVGECYVTGDLHCDHFEYSCDGRSVIGGRVTARQLASFFGPDDEGLHRGFNGQVDTPHAFFWFCGWSEVELPSTASIHVMCARNDFSPPDHPTWLYWSDDYFALRQEFCPWVESYWHDSPPWHFSRISEAIADGQSIWIDGFDPQCLPLLRQASEHERQQQYEQAFLHAKAAIALSPNHQPSWRKAGDALYFANAVEQSLRYSLRASELMPAHANLHDPAADEAAMAAFRLGQHDRAIELASASLARVKDDKDKQDKALPLRIRGQALMKKGDFPAARADLEKAIEYRWDSALQRWLAGLACYRLGEHKQADEHRRRAMSMSQAFGVEYTAGMDGADFRYQAPIRVDWEDRDRSDLPAETRDAAYWLRQLRHHDGDFAQRFGRIPVDILTRDFCLAAIALDPGNAQWKNGRISIAGQLPAGMIDDTIARALIDASAGNLPHVPATLRTKALLMRATRGHYEISAVPAGIIDRELALKLVEFGVAPDQMPPEWVDRGLCEHAIRHRCSAIADIPQALRDDAMYTLALAHADDAWFIENRLPSRYRTSEMICRALDLNFGLIHRLPGHLVDSTVYRHARGLDGDAESWQQLDARHGQGFRQHREDGGADCARDCWAVFWDEPFILAELARGDGGLDPWNLKPDHYTPAIAAMVAERHLIHLNCIPRQFITEAMARRFVMEYPEDFHDIPLPLRTQSVCEAAAANRHRDGRFFRHVPLPRRTVPMCIRALELDQDNVDLIPFAVRYEVFDQLIRTGHRGFSRGHLYNERGCSSALLGDHERALADFDFVIAGGSGGRKAGFLGKLLNRARGDGDDFDEDEVAAAMTYKAWACKLAGRFDQMQELMRDLDDDQREVAGSFAIAEPVEVVDFDLREYERHIRAAGELMERGDHRLARDHASDAERMLIAAGHPDPRLWAYVLDHLRFISAELGQDAENEALCRRILEHFADFQDLPYFEEHNIIRAARRAAFHNLAWRLADDPQASIEELEKARRYSRASLLFAPIEDEDEGARHFLETAAKVLLRVVAHDPMRQAELDATLDRIQALGVDAGVTDPAVEAALARHRQ